jgi:hypothetical protein
MGRAVVEACLPWLGLLAVALLAAYALVRLSRAKVRWDRLRELHRDQAGGVQSLSFVLTLPFFVMILLFIVQVSQLMIGTIVVHYAAFASARSAVVWIPADVQGMELANCISSCQRDPTAPDQSPPILDPLDPHYGPAAGGMTYVIEPGSPKYDKIAAAAVLACMPISPSRDLGLDLPGNTAATAGLLKAAYAATSPGSAANARVPKRLENKLAYALANTQVEVRFFHKNSEPPLVTYYLADDITEFRFNELGWQDQITVTVRHDLALLPGPGRLLARYVPGASGVDQVSQRIHRNGSVYTYPLTASATLGNEGEKSLVPYVQHMD